MSVWMWAFANHKIDFNQSKEDLFIQCIEILDALGLPNRRWVFDYEDEMESESGIIEPQYNFTAERVKKIKNWRAPKVYYDVGISRNYLLIDTSCFPWTHWFHPRNDEERVSRDKWIEYIHKVTRAFGGDTIMYFPDNMFECCKYMPGESCDGSFQECVDLLYAEHPYVYSSIEESILDAGKIWGGRVIVEHI